MPASENKIITKLQERRQIEAELETLAASPGLELRSRAQRIASMGSQVIPAIVSHLDRADARLLGALGVVTAFLDHDEVVAALRQAVLQSRRSDRGRIGAMTILERFLGEPLDRDLLTSLKAPEEAAMASLDEILAQAQHSPAILIEYVRRLDQQEPDVVLAMVRALQERGTSRPGASSSPGQGSGAARRVIEPLRMMAQDVRDEIAAEALRALGVIRLPEAARALQTLLPTSAPDLRPQAERALRKLRFVGVEIPELPDPDPAWRALASPVDGLGQQSVWFILEDRLTTQARFLNLLLSDQAGVVQAVGHVQVPLRLLPPRRLQGTVHDIALPDGSGANLMLEAPFDLGRRLVLGALAHNRETQIPVAGVLRLLGPWLWEVGGWDSLPPRALPELSAGDESLLAVSDRLLVHPAFSAWTLQSEATFQAAKEALRHPDWHLEVWVKRLAAESVAQPVRAQAFGQRLLSMSEWLLLAGEEALARLALVSAKALLEEAGQEHLFLQALIRRDLELALRSLDYTSERVPGTIQS